MSTASLLQAALPDLWAPMRLRGLESSVEIFRDALGVPHVRARSASDAFFAQGFVHSQDRLWQMCYDRAKGAGRLAEYLGPGVVFLDVFMRRLGIDAAARAEYDALDASSRAVLDAYAAGVNAYLETATHQPIELALLGVAPEVWRPWDCAAVLKVRHVLMGSFEPKLWRSRLLGTIGPRAAVAVGSAHGREDTLIVPPGARTVWQARPDELLPSALALGMAADGSNNWALHGSRTASGLPLVAGDPHRTLEVPNVYYQNHVACPEFDAIGLSMPGIPGMFHFGHNARVAWCVTHAMADNQDLFVERFDREGRYEFRGEWLAPERRTEVVHVRGGDPLPVDVTQTHHGPVLFGDPAAGSAITMRWTGLDRPSDSLRAVLPMLNTASVGELDDVMRSWVDPCNNLVMADVEGTIGYLHRGRVPVRSASNAWAPVPGWTGEHEWTGDVPFEGLPRLRNPGTGFIVTANNRVCADEHPYLGLDYSAPNRARRVVDRLEGLESATAEDMAAIHADRVSLSSRIFVNAVASLDSAGGLGGRARDLLTEWDGTMDSGATGASIYAAVRDKLAEVLVERDPLARVVPNPFGEEPYPTPAHTRIRGALPRLMAAGERSVLGGAEWGDVVGEAFERAVQFLERTLGPDPGEWRWGRLHTTEIRHPLARSFPEAAGSLNPPPVSCGGEGETVHATTAERGLGVIHASVARYVFDVANWDRSGWVVPLGSSGHPASGHYADQRDAWAEVRLYPMPYSWARIEAEAETTQRLEP